MTVRIIGLVEVVVQPVRGRKVQANVLQRFTLTRLLTFNACKSRVQLTYERIFVFIFVLLAKMSPARGSCGNSGMTEC